MDLRDYKIEVLYVARDKTGMLNLYSEHPHRNSFNEWVEDDHTCRCLGELDTELFPFLKWEDEPIKVKLETFK